MALEVVTTDIHGIPILVKVAQYPDECPICHHNIEPIVTDTTRLVQKPGLGGKRSRRLQIVFRCPRKECQSLFLGTYNNGPHSEEMLALKRTSPFVPISPRHPKSIHNLSPAFVEIYKQATHAEHFGLTEIAGMGYRKALEFLIKDFAIKQRPTDRQQIKETLLGTVINHYVEDRRVKSAAQRATWLGNDESHYVRKWADKDINDLKTLIQLSRNAIENSLLTDHYESSMPNRK